MVTYIFFVWSRFFSTFSLCLCSSSFNLLFSHIVFFQVTMVLSMVAMLHLHFKKHVMYYMSSFFQWVVFIVMLLIQNRWFNIRFFCASTTTNDEHVLLTIESKWLEVIMDMTKSKLLDLPCSKQVQLLISICVHGKFCLSTTSALVGF